MSKNEDNRDIFEKALDYAPAAGGVVGAIGGSRLVRLGRLGKRAYPALIRGALGAGVGAAGGISAAAAAKRVVTTQGRKRK